MSDHFISIYILLLEILVLRRTRKYQCDFMLQKKLNFQCDVVKNTVLYLRKLNLNHDLHIYSPPPPPTLPSACCGQLSVLKYSWLCKYLNNCMLRNYLQVPNVKTFFLKFLVTAKFPLVNFVL